MKSRRLSKPPCEKSNSAVANVAGAENNLENGGLSKQYSLINSMLATVLENNISVLGLYFVNRVSGVETGVASASEVGTTAYLKGDRSSFMSGGC